MTARTAAADVLHLARVRKQFASEIVEELAGSLSSQDRGLLKQLVMGVVRREATLDALLTPHIPRPHAVQDRVWDVLHLGAFQLVLLNHIPKHAAVHETVELANYVGCANAKGFVNGVLRRVSELVTDEYGSEPAADALPFAMGTSFSLSPGFVGERAGVRGKNLPPKSGSDRDSKDPLTPTKLEERGQILRDAELFQYRKLTRPVFPEPGDQPAAYLAAAFSWPRWLAERWLNAHGWDECIRLGFWFNSPPPLWLRTNKLRVSRETYRLQLAAAMIETSTGEHPQSLKLQEGMNVRELPGYDAGDFAIQDHSSLLVASALNPQPGNRILDVCSAPGGKTTHLAELMDNRGKIVACDIDAKRLDTVRTLAQRLGISIIETHLLKENDELPVGPFDAAIVDVPCSNTGVLGRRPEVRWRIKPSEFEHLIRLQTRLLIQAIERVKPNGVVVYSTCSIEPDENRGIVKTIQRGMKNVKLEAEHIAIPGQPSDGGYWARLRIT